MALGGLTDKLMSLFKGKKKEKVADSSQQPVAPETKSSPGSVPKSSPVTEDKSV